MYRYSDILANVRRRGATTVVAIRQFAHQPAANLQPSKWDCRLPTHTDVDVLRNAKRQQQGPAARDPRPLPDCMLKKPSLLCSVDISHSGLQTS